MRYDAFISYSHAADGKLAPALQEGLRKLARPWNRRYALRVFRDDTGLSVTAALWPAIEDALRDSDYFILLASPQAARSEWVNREIEYWLAHRDPAHVLPVVTSGDWAWSQEAADLDAARSTAAPPALSGAFHSEPRHLDLRWASDGASLDIRNTRFRDAVADIAATIHGIPKDELESEDLRQYRKTVHLRRMAIAGLAVLAAMATVGGVLASLSSQEARRQRDEAERRGRIALARQLETESRASLDNGQSERGLLLAIQSLEATKVDGSFLAAAETRLYEAIAALDSNALGPTSLELHPTISAERGDSPMLPFTAAFAPNGQTLLVGGTGGVVNSFPFITDIFSALDALVEHEALPSERPDGLPFDQSRSSSVLVVKFSPDGRWAAVSGIGLDLQLLPGAQLLSPDRHVLRSDGVISALDFAASSRLLVTGDDRGRVQLVDLANLQATPHVLTEHDDVVSSVAFSPDDRWIASGSLDGVVALRPLEDAAGEPRILRNAGPPIHALAFGRDDTTLAIGSSAGIEIRGGPDYGSVSRTMIPGEVVTSLGFGPDGRWLAAGSRDGSLRLWDIRDMGADVRELVGHERLISSVAFTPDGSWLASTSYDGTARVWPLDFEGLLNLGCLLVPQKLSADRVRAAFASAVRTDALGGSLIASACREPLRELTASRTRLARIPGVEELAAALAALDRAWSEPDASEPRDPTTPLP